MVFDPTNVLAQSSGSQYDNALWPSHATWSDDPSDSGVYASTTAGYALNYTMKKHAAVVAMYDTPTYETPGLIVFEITGTHPQYLRFKNCHNPNYVKCTDKLDISAARIAAGHVNVTFI